MSKQTRGVRVLSLIAAAIMAVATAATGQEELIGTWQVIEVEPARFTLAFGEEGGFVMVTPAAMFFEPDEEEPEDDFSLEPFFAGYEMRLTGRWEIDEEGLWIFTDEAEFLGGDTTLEEIIIIAARALAMQTAAEEDIAEEDYEDFEAVLIEFLLSEFPPDVLLSEANTYVDEEFFGTVFTYSVEGDMLTLTDEGGAGEASDLRKVVDTAVPEISWGQIKAAAR